MDSIAFSSTSGSAHKCLFARNEQKPGLQHSNQLGLPKVRVQPPFQGQGFEFPSAYVQAILFAVAPVPMNAGAPRNSSELGS